MAAFQSGQHAQGLQAASSSPTLGLPVELLIEDATELDTNGILSISGQDATVLGGVAYFAASTMGLLAWDLTELIGLQMGDPRLRELTFGLDFTTLPNVGSTNLMVGSWFGSTLTQASMTAANTHTLGLLQANATAKRAQCFHGDGTSRFTTGSQYTDPDGVEMNFRMTTDLLTMRVAHLTKGGAYTVAGGGSMGEADIVPSGRIYGGWCFGRHSNVDVTARAITGLRGWVQAAVSPY